MTKYYNMNQVHKYGYRPMFKLPTKEEAEKIAAEVVRKIAEKQAENKQ